ncbi:hypothetical protein T261_7265 [Streptomyces lydicus]|nr:hypothetical protein T261_7265 [Streptomyces lydicus]
MTAPSLLPQQDARTRRDRLEVLTALIKEPEFDPVLRGGVLKIPPTHPVHPWSCTVVDCARPRWRRYAMCSVHAEQWQEAETRGMSRAQFLRTAEPLPATEMPEAMMCRICPQRPAFSLQLVLCFRHRNRPVQEATWTGKTQLRHGPQRQLPSPGLRRSPTVAQEFLQAEPPASG